MSNLEKIRRAAHYMLPFYRNAEGVAQIASLYLRPLYGLFASGGLGSPAKVILNSCQHHHCVRVFGCRLSHDLANDDAIAEHVSPSEDGNGSQMQELTDPLRVLAATIWYTEYCLAEVTGRTKHYSQAFHEAQAVTPCQAQTIDPSLGQPYVSLWFTAAPAVFPRRFTTVEETKAVIRQWRGSHSTHRGIDYQFIPELQRLRMRSQRFSEDTFQIELMFEFTDDGVA